jgi:hypothetical protein
MKLDKKEFMKTWNNGWNFLYKLSPMLLKVSIFCMFGAGVLTWYGITYAGLAEQNFLLHPLFSMFGTASVLLFDIMATAVILIFYRLTRRESLRYMHVTALFLIYFAMMMDFLNDFSLVFYFQPLYGIFQNAPLKNMYQILKI